MCLLIDNGKAFLLSLDETNGQQIPDSIYMGIILPQNCTSMFE